ncbi:hypothetical protein BVRB_008880 [Beta vulgaris subsp. vulgaris]|uniref:Uncharacterized protein n=1 Tax=Beta vulgaris subsp. vulgaris TaxID=3555 RepID=A0A0J8B2M0_BETVV|nr:hypothetical protein BVRB_008880 [Beta vulgaris subsp. vulgaris]
MYKKKKIINSFPTVLPHLSHLKIAYCFKLVSEALVPRIMSLKAHKTARLLTGQLYFTHRITLKKKMSFSSGH